MSWYRLNFGGVELGDEIVNPLSSWRSSVRSSTSGSGSVEPILKLDDSPLAVVLYPRFKVRKVTENFLEFERWLFDLVSWADGERRWLAILNDNQTLTVDYGQCKLIELDRASPSGAADGRWSDEVVLTFQSDTTPTFYDWG